MSLFGLGNRVSVSVVLPEKGINTCRVTVKCLKFVLGQFNPFGEKGDSSVGMPNQHPIISVGNPLAARECWASSLHVSSL